MKKLIILIILIGIIGFSTYLFYREGTLPVNKTDTSTKIFIVGKGEPLNDVINNLSKEGLIRNRIVFYWVVKQKGIEKNIQAGSFRLSPSMNTTEIAEKLTHGTPLDQWVTIQEGLRKEEVAEIFSKEMGLSEVEFNEQANEGYLFPETYLIPVHATVPDVLKILTNTFNEKYTDEMKAKARQQGMTDEEVVILASLVEREAFGDSDRQQVANVLMKRYKEGIPFQVDATVQYMLGYQPQEKRWWKKELSLDDLKIQSLYNTYTHAGLPPNPIASPGIAAIEAVVNADADTPYLFYIHDADGKAHFARTSEEHQKNIDRYLN